MRKQTATPFIPLGVFGVAVFHWKDMPYIITGTATFSNQANRDAALARVNTAISSYPQLSAYTTPGFSAGVATPTTTTMTVSFIDGTDDATAAAIAKAIYDAWVASNRHTQGFLSINRT